MAGLEQRYCVKKIDDPIGKHDECPFFVLDPKHDKHAVTVLFAYADACAQEQPELASDLRRLAERFGDREAGHADA